MTTMTHSLPNSQNVTRVVLSNGIVVLVHTLTHVQSVVIAGSVRAGALFESPAQNGLASMTAAALMRGTQNRDFDAIYSAMEDIGADLSFGAGRHQVGFGGKSLAEDMPVLIDLLSDALRAPTFPSDQVDNLRAQRITELRYSQQDNRFRATKAFREALYPETHPYHFSSYGTIETLPMLTAPDLAAFHARHYGPQGMLIAVVGNVTPDEAIALIERHLGDWENPQQPPKPILPELALPTQTQHIKVTLPGKTQSAIVMGTVGPSTFDTDYRSALLANSILGEFGMMGRLGLIIREELGLAYYAYSRLDGGMGPGAWAIEAGVAPENVELTIETAREEVQRLLDELVTEEDLADNLSYFTGRLPLRMESASGIANQLIGLERYNLGLDFLVNYHEVMYRFTREDVQAAVRHYLNPAQFVIAVAGP